MSQKFWLTSVCFSVVLLVVEYHMIVFAPELLELKSHEENLFPILSLELILLRYWNIGCSLENFKSM